MSSGRVAFWHPPCSSPTSYMLKMFKWSLVGLFALVNAQSVAAPTQPEIPVPTKDCQAELAQGARPRVNLSVWRYYGQPNFNSVQHMNLEMSNDGESYRRGIIGWAHENGNYVVAGETAERQFTDAYLKYMNPLRDEKASNGEGDVVFERLQYYSLKLMEKINYLDAGSRRNFVQNSHNLHPNQVTLFEANEVLPASELKIKYGKVPEGARLDTRGNAWSTYQSYFDHSLLWSPFDKDGKESPPYVEPKPDPIYEVKVAVSWLISGQDLGRKTYLIPSEDDDLEVKIDRSKYKYIWEVGRAGQAMSGAYEETLRAMAYQAYWEVLALGGKIEDAFVFAHALDAVHARLFRSKFGMKDFSKYKDKPAERCLYGPLSEFLRRYPPETYSGEVAEIVRESEGKISGIAAMKMLFAARTQADAKLKIGESKIQLRDFNSGVELPMEDRDLITHTGKHPDTQTFHAEIQIQGTRSNRGDLIPLRNFLYSHRALEIAPDKKFTGSAKELLASALAYAQRNGPLHPDTRLCVTAKSGDLIRELREMEPMARWFVSRGRHVIMNGGFGFGGMGMQTVASPFYIETNCFLVKNLKNLPAASVTEPANNEAQRWLTEPEFFAP